MSVARAATGHNGCASAGRVDVAACSATDRVVRSALGRVWCNWSLDVAMAVGWLASWVNYDVSGMAVGKSDVVCRALCTGGWLAGDLGDDQCGVDSCFRGRAGSSCGLGTWAVGRGSWVVWRWVAGGVSVGLGGVAGVVVWEFRARVGRFGRADNFDLGRSGGHDRRVVGDSEVGAVVG